MASTIILTNNNLTRKKWAKDLFARILPDVEYNYLVGKGDKSIVQMRTELGKGEGDQITFGIRLPLQEDGQVGRETVEGNEERQDFKDFAMTIEELNKAVDTGGKMEQQRIPYDLMKSGRDGLQEWWSDALSDYVIQGLAGNSGYTFQGQAMGGAAPFANAFTEPDIYHALAVGRNVVTDTTLATSEAAQVSSDTMTLAFLDKMKQLAEVPYDHGAANQKCYKLRPLNLKGKNYFRVLMHNYVFDALRHNTNIGEWGDLQRASSKLAMPGVEIEYNGMLISKSLRLPLMVEDTTNDASGRSGVYRTLLLGAQAGCFAWGGAGETKGTVMSFVPYTKDAKRYIMIRGGGILGFEKTVFQSRDYGIITGSSYGKPISE